MRKAFFLPRRDSKLDKLEENFVNKLPVHAETLAITPAIVAEITEGINLHRESFSRMISTRAESRAATEENRLKKREAIDALRRGAKIVKSLRGYTRAIGHDLRIIAPKVYPVNTAELRPVLISKVNRQTVTLKYRKGDTHGIKIYSKRNDESEFTLLSISTVPPFVDKRLKADPDKPELREYYAIYFIGGNEVGVISDRIGVTIL